MDNAHILLITIQVRTMAMHHMAELGGAAHWYVFCSIDLPSFSVCDVCLCLSLIHLLHTLAPHDMSLTITPTPQSINQSPIDTIPHITYYKPGTTRTLCIAPTSPSPANTRKRGAHRSSSTPRVPRRCWAWPKHNYCKTVYSWCWRTRPPC